MFETSLKILLIGFFSVLLIGFIKVTYDLLWAKE